MAWNSIAGRILVRTKIVKYTYFFFVFFVIVIVIEVFLYRNSSLIKIFNGLNFAH